jgi:hypothetical protein
VGALRDGALDAYAVARMPSRMLPLHALLLLATAIILAIVFVALPHARSIARPLKRLGKLTRADPAAARRRSERPPGLILPGYLTDSLSGPESGQLRT